MNDAQIWTVIGVFVTALVGVVPGTWRLMRLEIGALRNELGGRIDTLEARLDGRCDGLEGRLDGLEQRLGDKIDHLDRDIQTVITRLMDR